MIILLLYLTCGLLSYWLNTCALSCFEGPSDSWHPGVTQSVFRVLLWPVRLVSLHVYSVRRNGWQTHWRRVRRAVWWWSVGA